MDEPKPSLDALPTELLIHIISYLKSHRPSLISLCVVNRRLGHLARKELYRHIVIGSDRAFETLLRLMVTSSEEEFLGWVEHVSIKLPWPRRIHRAVDQGLTAMTDTILDRIDLNPSLRYILRDGMLQGNRAAWCSLFLRFTPNVRDVLTKFDFFEYDNYDIITYSGRESALWEECISTLKYLNRVSLRCEGNYRFLVVLIKIPTIRSLTVEFTAQVPVLGYTLTRLLGQYDSTLEDLYIMFACSTSPVEDKLVQIIHHCPSLRRVGIGFDSDRRFPLFIQYARLFNALARSSNSLQSLTCNFRYLPQDDKAPDMSKFTALTKLDLPMQLPFAEILKSLPPSPALSLILSPSPFHFGSWRVESRDLHQHLVDNLIELLNRSQVGRVTCIPGRFGKHFHRDGFYSVLELLVRYGQLFQVRKTPLWMCEYTLVLPERSEHGAST